MSDIVALIEIHESRDHKKIKSVENIQNESALTTHFNRNLMITSAQEIFMYTNIWTLIV